jgi:hypothetical protein
MVILIIIRNQFAAAIDKVYYTTLDDPTEGLNAVNLHTLVMHILNIYAQISQLDLNDNMADFDSGIDSSPFCHLHEEAGEMSGLCCSPKKNMITTGTKHTLACAT